MKGDYLISLIENLFTDFKIDKNDSKTYGITTINKNEHEIFRVYTYDTRKEDTDWYISFSDFTHSFKIPNKNINIIDFINEIREIADTMVNVHIQNDSVCEKIKILMDEKQRLGYFRNKKLDNLL